MSSDAHTGAPGTSLLCLWLALSLSPSLTAQPSGPLAASNGPTARVVIVEDPSATDELLPVPKTIHRMVDDAITRLTGKSTVRAAWNSLVSTNDTVGLKVYSSPGENSGTRPAVVSAIVQDLIASGVRAEKIIIWDKQDMDLRAAGFYDFEERYGVAVRGALQSGFDTNSTNFYDNALLGTLIWSDAEFGQTGPGVGRKSFVSKVVSREMTKIINVTPMLHHNLVGVTGNLYSLAMGSVDNTGRFEKSADSLARAVPEIYAMPQIGDRVVLNVVDALICQYEGQDRGLLHYSMVMNQLRFSKDPLALDVLSLKEINRQRVLAGADANTNLDLYDNAALLEIGVADTNRIKIERLFTPPAEPHIRSNEPPQTR